MAILKPSEYEAMLRLDFYAFIERSFTYLNPQTRFERNWHIEVISAELDAVRRGETRRLIINVPPRSLKSHCASVALPAFMLGHNPAAQTLFASYAGDLAEKFARETRSVMTSPWYQRLFPTRLSPQKQSVQEFVTTRQGYRFATSVGGVLTGRGADLIVIDDPMKPNEALSDALRRSANEWFDNTLYSRLNNKETGAIVIIMQRLHEDDLVGHVLERDKNWRVLSFAAIAETEESYEIVTPFGTTRRFKRAIGEALHPERESVETLAAIRQTLGEYNYVGQYQQAPVGLDAGMVKAGWFQYYGPNECPAQFDRIVQSWDTANKISELADFSVCTTWGMKDKRIYLLYVLRKRLSYPDLKRAVREQQKMHRANIILIEDKASGTQLIQELVNDGLGAVKGVKPDGDKKMRFNAQTAIIENGFVYLPRDASWLADYLHEITTFPGAKYDDQADSTSQALAWISLQGSEPNALVAVRRLALQKLLREGWSVAEIAERFRKTPEQVQSWIDEENQRRGKANLKNPQAAPATSAGNRWNPWQGTLGPK